VQKYDPSAHLVPFTYYGPEGVENRQQVVYDESKLPKPEHAGMVFAGNTPLFDPSKVQHDSNYGDVTAPQNVNSHKNDSTWLDTIGPMIPLLAMTLGAGGGLAGRVRRQRKSYRHGRR
jgi:hypothetical protein